LGVLTETSFSLRTFEFGNEVDDQQVGCLWQGDYLVSLSLSGNLNYLDKNSPSKPTKVIEVKILLPSKFEILRFLLITTTIKINGIGSNPLNSFAGTHQARDCP